MPELKLVKSVSGTWHIWHSDIDGLARTDCDRLVKPRKYATIEWKHPSPRFPVRSVIDNGTTVFIKPWSCCCQCHWSKRTRCSTTKGVNRCQL